MTKDRELERV